MTDPTTPHSPSIIERLDMAGHTIPPVELIRLDGGDRTAPESTLRRTGRYEVIGNIARGGIGRILRGRDIDLNRDVALKVLREKHDGNGDLLERFVEEAQIGGQLQHPGVIPVYEIGLLDGTRPYFAMKLVKGRSLADHLAGRENPAEDRHRYLGIFARVCQAVGYAHSRGVIHRDLKPSNIMIGVYGEVLVIDWGFAKILARGGVADERRARRSRADMTRIMTVRTAEPGSGSLAGSIMGTPAYMPPEQALGQIQDLDQRSDVFSLGGILTEILTGHPPYDSGEGDVLVLAAKCRTEEALARLDRCGADPALIEIARSSLAPLKRDRPRDGAVLGRMIETFLAEAEEREHRHRIAAAEDRRKTAALHARASEERAAAEKARRQATEEKARVEASRRRTVKAKESAEWARRARRHTIVLAGAVLLTIMVGAGGYLLISGHRQESALTTATMVRTALDRAEALLDGGKHAEAVAVAEQAGQLARDRTSSAGTKVQAQAVLSRLREADTVHRAAMALAADNRRLLHRLDRIRFRFGSDISVHSTDSEFDAVFRDHDLDLWSGDPAEVAHQLAARGDAAPTLGRVLDEWSWLHRSPLGGAIERAERLAACASALDPHERRDRIRTVPFENQAKSLLAIAAGAGGETWEVRTLDLLGFALLQAGETTRAVEVLDDAEIRQPGDSAVYLHLASGFLKLDPPRELRASWYLTAACALKPGFSFLSGVIDRCSKPMDTLTPFREAIGWWDEKRYFSVGVTFSVMSELPQRIYVGKEAVTRALLDWPAGEKHEEWKEPPLSYVPGTTFVTETLNQAGDVIRTSVLRVRGDREPEFLQFDQDGRLDQTFREAPNLSLVPQACARCHLDRQYLSPPMADFPLERTVRRVELNPRYRSQRIVLRFREYYHRGGDVFGPYGAIWLTKLREDQRAGTLTEEDAAALAALKYVYPEILNR